MRERLKRRINKFNKRRKLRNRRKRVGGDRVRKRISKLKRWRGSSSPIRRRTLLSPMYLKLFIR